MEGEPREAMRRRPANRVRVPLAETRDGNTQGLMFMELGLEGIAVSQLSVTTTTAAASQTDSRTTTTASQSQSGPSLSRAVRIFLPLWAVLCRKH